MYGFGAEWIEDDEGDTGGSEAVFRRSREIVADLSAKFGITPPRVVFSRGERTSRYIVSKREIRLQANLNKLNEESEYSILHEFAHHVDHMRSVEARAGRLTDAFVNSFYAGSKVFPHGRSFKHAMKDVIVAHAKVFEEMPLREYPEVIDFLLDSKASPFIAEAARKRRAQRAERRFARQAVVYSVRTNAWPVVRDEDRGRAVPSQIQPFREVSALESYPVWVKVRSFTLDKCTYPDWMVVKLMSINHRAPKAPLVVQTPDGRSVRLPLWFFLEYAEDYQFDD